MGKAINSVLRQLEVEAHGYKYVVLDAAAACVEQCNLTVAASSIKQIKQKIVHVQHWNVCTCVRKRGRGLLNVWLQRLDLLSQ
jgi:hypothetical protein